MLTGVKRRKTNTSSEKVNNLKTAMKKLRTLIALTILSPIQPPVLKGTVRCVDTILSPIQPPVLKGTVRCVDHSTAIQAAKMTDD